MLYATCSYYDFISGTFLPPASRGSPRCGKGRGWLQCRIRHGNCVATRSLLHRESNTSAMCMICIENHDINTLYYIRTFIVVLRKACDAPRQKTVVVVVVVVPQTHPLTPFYRIGTFAFAFSCGVSHVFTGIEFHVRNNIQFPTLSTISLWWLVCRIKLSLVIGACLLLISHKVVSLVLRFDHSGFVEGASATKFHTRYCQNTHVHDIPFWFTISGHARGKKGWCHTTPWFLIWGYASWLSLVGVSQVLWGTQFLEPSWFHHRVSHMFAQLAPPR